MGLMDHQTLKTRWLLVADAAMVIIKDMYHLQRTPYDTHFR